MKHIDTSCSSNCCIVSLLLVAQVITTGSAVVAPMQDGDALIRYAIAVSEDLQRNRSAVHFERVWECIQTHCVGKLINTLERVGVADATQHNKKKKLFDNKTYAALYMIGHNLATRNNEYADRLRERHESAHACYLNEVVAPVFEHVPPSMLVSLFVRKWNAYTVFAKWMWKFFCYLDHTEDPNSTVEYRSLYKVSIGQFARFTDKVASKVMAVIVDSANHHRLGEQKEEDIAVACDARAFVHIVCCISRGQAAQRLDNITDLDKDDGDNDYSSQDADKQSLVEYMSMFHVHYIHMSRRFYCDRSKTLLDGMGLSMVEYVTAVGELKHRDVVFEQMLGIRDVTRHEMQTIRDEELLVQHHNALFHHPHHGILALLLADKWHNVGRVHSMYANVHDAHVYVTKIAELVAHHVDVLGKAIIAQREERVAAGCVSAKGDVGGNSQGTKEATTGANSDPHDAKFVEDIVHLITTVKANVETHFMNCLVVTKAVNVVFDTLLKNDVASVSCAVLFANYMDRLLRGKLGVKMDQAELSSAAARVMSLMHNMRDKDRFGEEYRFLLSKRLIDRTSTSDDVECEVVAHMKLACGSSYTAKMQGMISDLKIANDFHLTYQRQLKQADMNTHTSESHVLVLSKAYWPTYRTISIEIPPCLQMVISSFTTYYRHTYCSRKLTWLFANGKCSVRAVINKRPYYMQMSTVQAIVLLQFHKCDREQRLSFGDLAQALQCDTNVLKKVLHSLSCQKRFMVLAKFPPNAVIHETDAFSVNHSFRNPSQRINAPVINLQESKTLQIVDENRRYAIDAAIVRVMKARKTMKHNDLEAEVFRHLQYFQPTPKDIKVRT